MEKDSTKNNKREVPSSLLNYGNAKISFFYFFFHINKPVLQNCHSLTQTLTTVHTLPFFTVINHLMSVPCEVANCTFAINLSSNFF